MLVSPGWLRFVGILETKDTDMAILRSMADYSVQHRATVIYGVRSTIYNIPYTMYKLDSWQGNQRVVPRFCIFFYGVWSL